MLLGLSPLAVLTKMTGPGSRKVKALFTGKLFIGIPRLTDGTPSPHYASPGVPE
ncbi:MAG: hypothetical protein LBK62_08920 [Treponema sp.]|nr:hypothetical protein [Treponema sp.]